MKKLNLTQYLLILLLILTPSSLVYTAPNDVENNILLQKLAHENNIRERFTKGVSTILKPEEYLLSISIELQSEAELEKNRAERKKKRDELRAKELKEAKEKGESAKIKAGDFVVGDITRYEDGEDLLYMDKFDFSTPLEISKPEDRGESSRPYQSFADGGVYVETIADRVKNINVEVLIENSISKESTTMVQNLLAKINTPVLGLTPKISFGRIALIPLDELKKKQEEKVELDKKKKQELEDAQKREDELKAKMAEMKARTKKLQEVDWLEGFKTPLAIVIAALAMLLIGYYFVTSGIKFGNKFLTTIDDVFSRPGTAAERAGPPTGAGGEGVGLASMEMSGGSFSLDDDVPLVGFDRFVSLLKSSPTEALLLIRRWISNEEDGTLEALTIVIKKASTDELLYMFDNLTVNERSQWKKKLKTNLTRQGLRLGDTFMEAQIMDGIILPPPTLDLTSKEILSRLSPQECAELIQDDFEVGSVLLNVLPFDFLARTFDHVDPETTLLLADYGLNYTDGLLNEKKEELKEMLLKIKDKQNPAYTPFLDKIIEMIPNVGIAKEDALFDSLFRNGQTETLKQVAIQHFPASLIKKAPQDFIKKIIMKYPRKQRVEYLLSLTTEDRTFFLSIFGGDTEKMRSFIEADLEVVAKNEILLTKIKKNKDKIGKAFIQFVREYISDNKASLPEMERLVEDWVDNKTQDVEDDFEEITEAA
ncbi:MAG: hypothetical protein ISR65_10430 [Bacteriovoracaceae bacterium]|nr:hypothetical protein [Bacteriovoracaceae bacterium]